MDGILKLVVGCLGLVGLIVMVVPNSDPLSPENAQSDDGKPSIGAPSNANAPLPPPPVGLADEPPAPSKFVVEDYNINNFGQPMVDPTPPGQREVIAQQRQMQQQQANEIYNNQFASGQENLGQPQNGGSQAGNPTGQTTLPTISGN